jgi:hypothetical protein
VLWELGASLQVSLDSEIGKRLLGREIGAWHLRPDVNPRLPKHRIRVIYVSGRVKNEIHTRKRLTRDDAIHALVN